MTLKELLEICKKNGCKTLGGCNEYLIYHQDLVEESQDDEEYERYVKEYDISLDSSIDDVLAIIEKEEKGEAVSKQSGSERITEFFN